MQDKIKIIAVDCDGTLFEDDYASPKVGKPRIEVIEWVKRQKALGHKIILWTCREGEMLKEAVKSSYDFGIVFDAINENIPQCKFNYLGQHKVLADIYLDDKALKVNEVVNIVDANDFIKG